MAYNSIVLSSGHGKYVRGAAGSPVPPQLDEVDEARRMVDRIAEMLRDRGVGVAVFHDNESRDQQSNLDAIVAAHNCTSRQLDVSVHLNAFDGNAHGTEVIYVTQEALASELSLAISDAGHFTNRGGKADTRGLAFLHKTEMPAVLLEVCFCDNTGDSNLYREHFEDICCAIADVLGGEAEDDERPDRPERPGFPDYPHEPDSEVLFHDIGLMSTFGGPSDTGMAFDEGLAFHFSIHAGNQQLFLPIDEGTGLGRRLNPAVNYFAARFDYSTTPKEMLAGPTRALVRATRTGREALAWPADWGPAEHTDRKFDLSEGLAEALGIQTDDEVEVTYPAPED